jgi:hypothetical protein
MFVVEHPDDDAEKPADLGHPVTLRHTAGLSGIEIARQIAFRGAVILKRCGDSVEKLRRDIDVTRPGHRVALPQSRPRKYAGIAQRAKDGTINEPGEVGHTLEAIAELEQQPIVIRVADGRDANQLDGWQARGHWEHCRA